MKFNRHSPKAKISIDNYLVIGISEVHLCVILGEEGEDSTSNHTFAD